MAYFVPLTSAFVAVDRNVMVNLELVESIKRRDDNVTVIAMSTGEVIVEETPEAIHGLRRAK